MKMSETAINEITGWSCGRHAVARSMSRRSTPLFDWVRPDFERILDRLDGKKRWPSLALGCGRLVAPGRVRDSSRATRRAPGSASRS